MLFAAHRAACGFGFDRIDFGEVRRIERVMDRCSLAAQLLGMHVVAKWRGLLVIGLRIDHRFGVRLLYCPLCLLKTIEDRLTALERFRSISDEPVVLPPVRRV